MIAKVRIAPIEHWCDAARNVEHDWKPGDMCTIDTTSMVRRTFKSHPEEARFWASPGNDRRYICEHMLEMD